MQTQTRKATGKKAAQDAVTAARLAAPDVTAAIKTAAVAAKKPRRKQAKIKLPPVARVLSRAIDEIANRGWCQGMLESHNGRVCMLGALSYAAAENDRLERVATQYLKNALPDRFTSIPRYNDRRGRTKREVLGKFREAINAAVKDGV